MKKAPLILSALFVALVVGAWQWSHTMAARLEDRVENGQPLQIAVALGTSGVVKYTPPLTDAFTLLISDLSEYKSGYTNERWRVEQLKFRIGSKHPWKVLPESFWRDDWELLRGLSYYLPYYLPTPSTQQKEFSLFEYSRKRELLVGQYQMRARYNCEFHDNRSGIRFLGDNIFDFNFHVNPAPKGKKRVVLDSVRKIG